MRKNEHKLVQDLFPSYIDGLTTQETNEYIEEHLETCEECKKILEDMKTKLQEENHTDLNDKKVQYAKKVNKKLKILSLVGWLILIAIVAVVVDFDRKAVILRNLQAMRKSVFGLQ
ncbi:MAG: zf-HC2 domain-containing protein [Clostridia bacterium]|nr:zf-HC2 domain-containing protein [Clostridia bacterium]